MTTKDSEEHHRFDMTNILPQLTAIASSVIYAAEAGDIENVLERIAEISRELIQVHYAALGIPDGQGGLRYFKVAGLTPEEIQHIGHLPKGHGLLGAIMSERQAIRLASMADDSRSAGFCANHPHMNSFLGVPVQVGGRLFGMLYLCDRLDGQPFTESDQALVEILAGYAALAIAGSHLTEQQSRLTVLEERERIGMELHDGVIQSLYALGMHVDLIRTSDAIRADDLMPVISGLNTVIEDIREYIMNLHKRHYQKGIFQSLWDLVSQLHVPQTISVVIHAPQEPPPFTPATFEAICQIVNEGVSNAVRHSHANSINIAVDQTRNEFIITIQDDGQGFILADSIEEHAGLGLRNMQRRARIHGGTVEIETAPKRGTCLTIVIPH